MFVGIGQIAVDQRVPREPADIGTLNEEAVAQNSRPMLKSRFIVYGAFKLSSMLLVIAKDPEEPVRMDRPAAIRLGAGGGTIAAGTVEERYSAEPVLDSTRSAGFEKLLESPMACSLNVCASGCPIDVVVQAGAGADGGLARSAEQPFRKTALALRRVSQRQARRPVLMERDTSASPGSLG